MLTDYPDTFKNGNTIIAFHWLEGFLLLAGVKEYIQGLLARLLSISIINVDTND